MKKIRGPMILSHNRQFSANNSIEMSRIYDKSPRLPKSNMGDYNDPEV